MDRNPDKLDAIFDKAFRQLARLRALVGSPRAKPFVPPRWETPRENRERALEVRGGAMADRFEAAQLRATARRARGRDN